MSVLKHEVELGPDNQRLVTYTLAPPRTNEDRASLGSTDPSKPVAEGTVYASLTRKAVLPSLKPASTTDKHVKRVYEEMAAGSFSGTYYCGKQVMGNAGSKNAKEVPTFLLVAGSAADENDLPPSLRGKLIKISVFYDYDMQLVKVFHDTTAYSKEFSNLLRPEEKGSLANRILHVFLRSLATEIPSVAIVAGICEFLNHNYTQERNYRGCLDASIVKGDFFFHRNHSNQEDIGKALIKVGEYLEAVKEVEKGARIYAQVVDTCFASETDLRVIVCHHAGLAFRNAGLYDEAEDYLVLGWSILCQERGGLDLNGDDATDIFTCMLLLYHMRQESIAREGRSNGRNEVVIQPLYNLLISLLYTAGFRASNGGRSHDMIFKEGPKFSRIFLKRSLRGNRQGALRAMIEAGSQPSREHFQQSLLNATDPKVKETKFSSMTHPDDPYFKSDPKDTAKTIRTMLKESDQEHTVATMYTCSYCKTCEVPGGPKHKKCPCQAAFYCGRDCQVAHWKEHKKYCAFKNKK